jgi:GDP-4-dehydro-6-deoxy-D-mannose reductase
MRRVLVTGVTGFAGSHLVDYMAERGDAEIWGIQRWRSRTENIEHLRGSMKLVECDLRDAESTRDTIEQSSPTGSSTSPRSRSCRRPGRPRPRA